MNQSSVESHHFNTLYLLAALCMIFMTMALAMQPVYLHLILDIGLEDAGVINSNIQVMTEILDLIVIGYFGYLSDKFGRVCVVVYGFIVAGIAALILPISLEVGAWLGVGGLFIFYLMRIIMSLGTTAVWPQLAVIAGDFSTRESRATLMSKTAFMMAFGATLVYGVLMQIPKYSGVVIAMFTISLVAFAGAWFAKRSLVDVSERTHYKKIPWKQVYQLVQKDRRLQLSFMSAFAARNDMVLIGLYMMLWFIYFADVAGVSQEEAVARGGTLIGVIGVVILISIPFWGFYIRRFGRISAIAVSMSLSGVGFISMWLVVSPYEWGIYVPAIILAIGQAGTLLAPQILTVDLSPPKMRGFTVGAFNTVGGLGMIFFVQAGGILFDWFGPYAPFVLAGFGNLIFVCFALAILKTENEPALHEVNELNIAEESA